MQVLLLQGFVLIAIVLITALGVLTPYWLRSRGDSKNTLFLGVAHSLVGGVFVGAAMLHLLPDALENASFELVGGLVVVGLLFADISETMAVPNSRDYATAAAVAISRQTTSKFVYVPEQSYCVGKSGSQNAMIRTMSEADARDCYRHHRLSWSDDVRSIDDVGHHQHSLNADELTEPMVERKTDVVDSHGNGVHHHHIDVGPGALSWVIAFMLSVHSLVTGAAFGIAPDLKTVTILAIVILSHKGVEAFAVSFNFSEGHINTKTILVILFYGIMTPLGAVLAIVARQFINSSTTLLVESILEAFAIGTFLYVGVMHMQDKTFCHHGWFVAKVLPEVLGATLMWLVSLWI